MLSLFKFFFLSHVISMMSECFFFKQISQCHNSWKGCPSEYPQECPPPFSRVIFRECTHNVTRENIGQTKYFSITFLIFFASELTCGDAKSMHTKVVDTMVRNATPLKVSPKIHQKWYEPNSKYFNHQIWFFLINKIFGDTKGHPQQIQKIQKRPENTPSKETPP